jgi:ABC-type glycerol-3-phosphate transport system permease component
VSSFGPPRKLSAAVMILLGLAIVLPLAWVARIALKPPEAYIGDPVGWGGGVTLDNISDAWSIAELDSAIVNSLLVVPLGAVGATILATLTGFALAKLDFVGKRIVWAAVIISLSMPLAALALPIFDIAVRLGFLDSRLGLSVIFTGLFASWGSLFMYAYFRSLPDELLESARVDGARLFRAFVTIAVPLALPAIVTTFFLNVFIQWSELILSLVMLPDSDKRTLTVATAQLTSQFRSTGPLQAAGMLIAAAPILVLFLGAQRWIRAETFTGGVEK